MAKPKMKELTKPIKELTLEERRARQRYYMERYLDKIKSDPDRATRFKERSTKNYRKFYDSIRKRPRRQDAN